MVLTRDKTRMRILMYYVIFNTNLLHSAFYSLITSPTCFGLSCWSSSRNWQVFRRMQLIRNIIWQRFYVYDSNCNWN